jgi:hypothetical protein
MPEEFNFFLNSFNLEDNDIDSEINQTKENLRVKTISDRILSVANSFPKNSAPNYGQDFKFPEYYKTIFVPYDIVVPVIRRVINEYPKDKKWIEVSCGKDEYSSITIDIDKMPFEKLDFYIEALNKFSLKLNFDYIRVTLLVTLYSESKTLSEMLEYLKPLGYQIGKFGFNNICFRSKNKYLLASKVSDYGRAFDIEELIKKGNNAYYEIIAHTRAKGTEENLELVKQSQPPLIS